MKKNIAIVSGGDSSERVISYKSAEEVEKNIDKNLYNTFLIYLEQQHWYCKWGDSEIPVNKEAKKRNYYHYWSN